MAFRIVSIENPAEVHVANGQLLVEQDDRSVTVPVSDMLMLVVSGPNIRMSTMAQAILADAHVIICQLRKSQSPSRSLMPVREEDGRVRDGNVGHGQEGREAADDLAGQRAPPRLDLESGLHTRSCLRLPNGLSIFRRNPQPADAWPQKKTGQSDICSDLRRCGGRYKI